MSSRGGGQWAFKGMKCKKGEWIKCWETRCSVCGKKCTDYYEKTGDPCETRRMDVEIIGHVREVDPDAPAEDPFGPWAIIPATGERVFMARRVADLVAEHGWTFPLNAVFGEVLGGNPNPLISLDQFRDRDLEDTWVVLGWGERSIEPPA